MPYVRPSENGNRTGTRRVVLGAPGVTVGVSAVRGGDFDFSAARFATRDLVEARHQHELRPAPWVEVHLDHRVMGVGGDDSWTACVHADHLVTPPTAAAPAAFGFVLDARPSDAGASSLLDAHAAAAPAGVGGDDDDAASDTSDLAEPHSPPSF